MLWAEANHRPRSVQNYRWNLDQLKKSFGGKMRSQISPFNVEKHKQARIAENAKVSANRENTDSSILNEETKKGAHHGS
jgi:hypothetical protein